jgi:Fic/DOC family
VFVIWAFFSRRSRCQKREAGPYSNHTDLFEMAAAYLFHMVKNHPFVDGNRKLVSLRLTAVSARKPRQHPSCARRNGPTQTGERVGPVRPTSAHR